MGVVDAIGVEAILVKVLEAGECGGPPLPCLTPETLLAESYLVGHFQVGRELGDEAEALAMGLLPLGSGLGDFYSGHGVLFLSDIYG